MSLLFVFAEKIQRAHSHVQTYLAGHRNNLKSDEDICSGKIRTQYTVPRSTGAPRRTPTLDHTRLTTEGSEGTYTH